MAYKAGESILTTKPFVHVIYSNWKGKRCDHCFKVECMRCKHMYYCNRKCQEKDWLAWHKVECKAKFHEIMNDFANCIEEKKSKKPFWQAAQIQLAFRYLVKTKLDPTSVYHEYQLPCGPTSLSQIQVERDLKHGTVVMRTAAIWSKIISSKYLKKFFGNSGSMFYNAVALIDKYQVRVTDTSLCLYELTPEETLIGEALYPELIGYSHSCIPNASFTFTGTFIRLNSLVDGLTDPKIKINFLEIPGSPQALWLPKNLRQDCLISRNLDCHCALCCSENSWGDQDFQNLIKGLMKLKYDRLDSCETHISALTNFIEKTRKVFGDNHPTLTLIYFRLVYYLIVKQRYSLALETIDKLINAINMTHNYNTSKLDIQQFKYNLNDLKPLLSKKDERSIVANTVDLFSKR